jgi:S-(hydroxymethyl)glutathione dehydrogenase/alcohol dehydrogenase
MLLLSAKPAVAEGGTAVVVGVAAPKDTATIRPMSLTLDELITCTYRIDEAPAAFRDLVAGRNARGVIVIGKSF